jgi:hypothetical protein
MKLPEWVVSVAGRPMCWAGWCNITCRGRRDHYGILPGNRYARWLDG